MASFRCEGGAPGRVGGERLSEPVLGAGTTCFLGWEVRAERDDVARTWSGRLLRDQGRRCRDLRVDPFWFLSAPRARLPCGE